MTASILSPSLPLLCPSVEPHQGSLPYTLDDLVGDIKAHLGESGGIGYANINSDYLMSLAQKYNSNPNDWARYYHNCAEKSYTRNTIENINSRANILLLVWNPRKGSPVHDHANAHCVLKVLAGELTETIYDTPEDEGHPLRVKKQSTYHTDQVTYMSDEIGLHRVHNPHPTQVAVSLHLYTPPNAADIGYNVFDEATGKASFIAQAKSLRVGRS
ncbi:unnamed protein product [Clonostachys solani]|uniref:Cysteine dioxygenase n=1 Tax=Clonostachys solani TaxID=160281 RepID=A0A9N9YWY9_9HYPO|nr:unnamed protein product [Clonostachys solani]